MLPTKEQVEAVPGTPLTKEDLNRLQAEGHLPKGMDILTGAPTLHKLKSGDQEILVIMMDPPPCGCIRLPTGKKKRCRRHRLERAAKRKARKEKDAKEKKEKEEREAQIAKRTKTKMVKDDESDRKKVVELRHAADSESDEDKAIEGAITPDKVCAVGPAGVAVLVDIDKAETAEVGPRATLHNKQRMSGVLVKGAHETPQFIPMEKVQKDASGKPKYRHYTLGRLVRGRYGEAVFFADGQCPYDQYGNPKNMRITGVDTGLQKRIGDTVCLACEVEVNEKGMPIIKQIVGADDVPKDKSAAVGVMNKNSDGIIVFIQTAGQKLGSSDNAPCVVCTPADKLGPGGVIGKAYQGKDGNIVVLPIGTNPTVSDQRVVGTMLQGTYRQPVYVNDVKRSECPSASNIAVVKNIEKEAKSRLQHIEKADVVVQAKVQNKTCKEIVAEKAAEKAAKSYYNQEVHSMSLAGGGYYMGGGGGNRSFFAREVPSAGTRTAKVPVSRTPKLQTGLASDRRTGSLLSSNAASPRRPGASAYGRRASTPRSQMKKPVAQAEFKSQGEGARGSNLDKSFIPSAYVGEGGGGAGPRSRTVKMSSAPPPKSPPPKALTPKYVPPTPAIEPEVQSEYFRRYCEV